MTTAKLSTLQLLRVLDKVFQIHYTFRQIKKPPRGSRKESVEENVKKKGASESAKLYNVFSETYSKMGTIEPDQLNRTFVTMEDYARMYSVSRQAIYQLFRRGEVRGVKVLKEGWKRVKIYLDPTSGPSYIRTPSKLLAARKAALKSAHAQRDPGRTLEG